ncbi:MAG TPA: hypothetical protein VJ508_05260 [Saprospiraceae bacterium]|nr:hypothetical protein [Saprospiraceae bacterium]
MTYVEFKESLNKLTPPDVSDTLKALWYDAKGDWKKAHELISEVENMNNNRIHAYLHRKEGDIGNADYWYAKSGEKRPAITLEEEWRMLVERYLRES